MSFQLKSLLEVITPNGGGNSDPGAAIRQVQLLADIGQGKSSVLIGLDDLLQHTPAACRCDVRRAAERFFPIGNDGYVGNTLSGVGINDATAFFRAQLVIA
ncbi:hypothetical protein ELE36_00030 (plasmid) [Pseudolysobacter antarcticus]|uniref:Uncharacterized protein n=1 Tax=Pseudolysobacter antarcticus TaxID=2511995 RepID=A0A411HEJ4_9GAMM|nr:hypothetical protein [Pseudolysobacter antarcticus]QBB68889.1 hypothetical protein ELE36_00030 [Pseudolysobacter antarcticus]